MGSCEYQTRILQIAIQRHSPQTVEVSVQEGHDKLQDRMEVDNRTDRRWPRCADPIVIARIQMYLDIDHIAHCLIQNPI
jgi:hypothetical protein